MRLEFIALLQVPRHVFLYLTLWLTELESYYYKLW